VADALSRAPVGESENVDDQRENLDFHSNGSSIPLFLALTREITLDKLREEQKVDPEVQAILTDLPGEFVMRDGILYKKGKYGGKLPFIPLKLREQVLSYFHDRPDAGHMGFRKTLYRILRRVFWFHMHEDIYKFITTCETCQKCKNPNTKPQGELQSVRVNGPWDMLAMDLIGPLPRTQRQHTQLLVVTDHFTKWVELFPLREATASLIAKKLESEIFCRFGRPRSILSDNGAQFLSKIVEKLCKTWGIKSKHTTTYHPQCNITERVNRNIVAILRAYTERRHTKWDENLPEVAMALRTAVSDTTGFSPSMLNFGREISTPFDIALEEPGDDAFETWIDHKNALIDRLSSVYALARANMEKAQISQARNYNKKRTKIDFEIGDLVLLRTHVKSDKARKIMKKFAYKWEGPYKVAAKVSHLVYSLSEMSGDTAGSHNVCNLKRYWSRPANSISENLPVQSAPAQKTARVKQSPISRTYNLRSRQV